MHSLLNEMHSLSEDLHEVRASAKKRDMEMADLTSRLDAVEFNQAAEGYPDYQADQPEASVTEALAPLPAVESYQMTPANSRPASVERQEAPADRLQEWYSLDARQRALGQPAAISPPDWTPQLLQQGEPTALQSLASPQFRSLRWPHQWPHQSHNLYPEVPLRLRRPQAMMTKEAAPASVFHLSWHGLSRMSRLPHQQVLSSHSLSSIDRLMTATSSPSWQARDLS